MLGIVILNYKSYSDTIKCVDSITETTVNTDYKIYIVDNDSPDSSYERLRKIYKNNHKIQVIQSGKNGGYSFGNNIGSKQAIQDGCDAILISNTDIIYFKETIDSMYRKLFKNNDIAVVGPNMIDSSDKYCQITILPPSIKDYWMSKKPFSLFSKKNKEKSKYTIDYIFRGMVQGSSYLIKSDTLEKIGFFDENVFLFGEELILANKLNKENMDTLIDSKALVLHDHSTTISKEGIAFERYHMYYSTIYVLRRYAGCSNIEMSFAILYSLIFYGLKSLGNKAYRQYLPKLTERMISLYDI